MFLPLRGLIPSLLLCLLSARAAVVEVDLTVAETQFDLAGRTVRALTLNGRLPGPTLRFREGDTARIRVRNALADASTSLHWHGLLLPNPQDGVPYLTTPPIAPGATYTYEFPLRQTGTYWYHSHTGLQEQQGVYGAIVVSPREAPAVAERDEVLILSDWTDRDPAWVMRSLMTGNPWHARRKGTFPNLVGAIQAGALGDYLSQQWHRMPPMDVSDIAYDAFLINGIPSLDLPAAPGESIRLRVINAGAATPFYLESSAGPLTVLAADGPEVEPFPVARLLVAMGETYDLRVTVPAAGALEFRATAFDGSGQARALIGQGSAAPLPPIPRPDLYRMDEVIAATLDDNPDAPRPLSPYARLRSPVSTAIDPARPRRTLPLRLTGDMERYVWSINGKTLAEDSVIPVARGEILRLEIVNDTMMHHPMHLHGFFFRLVNPQGDHAPLKHTVDVPPMGRRVLEFAADEVGDWFFHCHLLYHMDAGMARVFRVGAAPGAPPPDFGPAPLDPWYGRVEGSLQSHMSMGMASLMNARHELALEWDAAWTHTGDGHDHDRSHEVMAEVDATFTRYVTPNVSLFAGARFTREMEEGNRPIAGVLYRLPFLIHSRLGLDGEGDARVDLSRTLPVTTRLSVFGEAQYDTGSDWEGSAGATFHLRGPFSLIVQHHSEHGFGGGIHGRF